MLVLSVARTQSKDLHQDIIDGNARNSGARSLHITVSAKVSFYVTMRPALGPGFSYSSVLTITGI